MGKYYAIQQVERAAQVYIFGDITKVPWLPGDVSASSLVREIQGLDADVIDVHIDSYGGDVSEGWAIYNALKAHPAKVRTYGDGFVASAALYPFLAGEERIASNLSAYYLHQVVSGAKGYAEDLRAAADDAETMTEIGVGAFVDNTPMTAEEVRDLMKAETWLTPSEALDRGIATAILADPAPQYAQSAKRQLLQKVLQKAEPHEMQSKPQKTGTPVPSIMQLLAGAFHLTEKEDN